MGAPQSKCFQCCSQMAAPFIFPVTGNTLVRMCQDAYEEGHKSLTVVLRPRIRIVVGDVVDTACKKPRAAVEKNATYDRNSKRKDRHIKPDNEVLERADTRRVYEDRRIGSDNEISWDSVLNTGSINIEVTEVTNNVSKIQAPLTALSEGSSDTSDVDSDDSSIFVYKPADENIRRYASSSKQAASFESTGSVTTSAARERKPSLVSPSLSPSPSFSKPQSHQSAFQSWQSTTSSIFDEANEVPGQPDEQRLQSSSILSFIKSKEKEELEQLALYSIRNPSKEHRYRFRPRQELGQMKTTLVIDYKRLEVLKLGGGKKWYSGDMPTVTQKQQMTQNLRFAYRFADGYRYFIDNNLLNANEIITLVQASQPRFISKLQLALQVYKLFTELGDKAFDRAGSMELTFLGRYSPPQHEMILDYVKQYGENYNSEYNPGEYDTMTETSSVWESEATWW